MVKTAHDISRKQVFFCQQDDPLSDVAKSMHSRNIGSILVKKGDTLKGIITVNDILREVQRNTDMHSAKAGDVMSSPVVTAHKDLEVDELVKYFNEHDVSRMVLVDDDEQIAGVVRDIAVFKYMTFYKYDREARKLFAGDYRDLY